MQRSRQNCGFQEEKKRAESYYKSIQEEMRATDLKAWERHSKRQSFEPRCQSCSRGPINSARTHSAFVYDAEWRVHCAKNCVPPRTRRTAGECALDWIWQYCGGGWSWVDEKGGWERGGGWANWLVLCRVEWAGPTTWQIGGATVAYQAAAASAHLILLTKQHSGPNNALCPRASQLSRMISQHKLDGLSNSMPTNTSRATWDGITLY